MPDPIQKALGRIEELGRISDHPDHLARTFLSDASKTAARRLMEWMAEAGMEVHLAADGTVRGVFAGADPDARPLLLGSHHDTVIDAGKYDGALGILSAIAAVEMLHSEDVTLPFPLHVLGFSDEEGIRFHSTYLGSKSVAGMLDETELAVTDAHGVSVAEAIRCDGFRDGVSTIRYEPGGILGYVELHIEQGRVLENDNIAVGAVSGISGQTRLAVGLTGRADHAGTTPMALRHDALAGAAECILAAERLALDHTPLVVTVGRIEVHPGASNSVPGASRFTVDLRHPDDFVRKRHLAGLRNSFESIAAKRGLDLNWSIVQDGDAVPCDPALTQRLFSIIEEQTGCCISLASGAGHDAVVMSRLGPVAMVFVRCRDGLSHHPDEYAAPDDIASGIRVLVGFLKSFQS